MFAIRDDRTAINQEDFVKAARKVADAKKHESQYLFFFSVAYVETDCLCSQIRILDVVFFVSYP